VTQYLGGVLGADNHVAPGNVEFGDNLAQNMDALGFQFPQVRGTGDLRRILAGSLPAGNGRTVHASGTP
jgi:hypothetical protein